VSEVVDEGLTQIGQVLGVDVGVEAFGSEDVAGKTVSRQAADGADAIMIGGRNAKAAPSADLSQNVVDHLVEDGLIGEPYTLPNTRLAFVPPNPKLLLITVLSWMSLRARRIGMPSNSGSSSSILALSAAKPACIIKRQ